MSVFSLFQGGRERERERKEEGGSVHSSQMVTERGLSPLQFNSFLIVSASQLSLSVTLPSLPLPPLLTLPSHLKHICTLIKAVLPSSSFFSLSSSFFISPYPSHFSPGVSFSHFLHLTSSLSIISYLIFIIFSSFKSLLNVSTIWSNQSHPQSFFLLCRGI